MRLRSIRSGLVLAALVAGFLTSCDQSPGGVDRADAADSPAASEEEAESTELDPADQSICRADATALASPYAEGFPTAWTFPADTTVYDVEDRGSTGIIVTAVSSAPFEDILDFLNNEQEANGFEVTEGETEDDDAEANWQADGYTGRWTIQKSATCDGETVMQVLATSAG